MRRALPIALTLALLGPVTACETASEAGAGLAEEQPVQLSIRGHITPKTLDQLGLLFSLESTPSRAVVYLASGGGDLDTALTIARWLERVPRSTAIVTRECDSACLVIFAAARERLVSGDAVFSAHGPECTAKGLLGLPCRLFWEPRVRDELHDRVARISPPWIDYLDGQTPPAFARRGADFVRVTGDQLIAFGAAAPLNRGTMRAALEQD